VRTENDVICLSEYTEFRELQKTQSEKQASNPEIITGESLEAGEGSALLTP